MSKQNNKNLIQYQTLNSYQIYLNSKNATSFNNLDYKSDCTFYIPDLIDNTRQTIELRVSLVNAQIPKSFYLINSYNNKINIIIQGIQNSYYFPYGNYNINSFISQWNSTVGTNWILTLNSSTNTLNIANTLYDFIISDDNNNSIFEMIGFKKGISYVSSNKILISPYPINFLGLSRLLILCPTFNFHSKTSYDYGETSVIACIPNISVNNGLIFYNNVTNYKTIFNDSQLSYIQIQIVDDSNNLINFNNIDWSLTIQIDDVHEVIQDLSTIQEIYEFESNNF
jgi:hypothetical protein